MVEADEAGAVAVADDAVVVVALRGAKFDLRQVAVVLLSVAVALLFDAVALQLVVAG